SPSEYVSAFPVRLSTCNYCVRGARRGSSCRAHQNEIENQVPDIPTVVA
ncbi:unnamed protein product, partial [Allacma fusca]